MSEIEVQIWLNLPKSSKRANPHFEMMWREQVPKLTSKDEAGRTTTVTLVAGSLLGVRALPPPPDSEAAQDPALAIWTVSMEPMARFTLPEAGKAVGRVLYLFRGSGLRAANAQVPAAHAVQLSSESSVELEAGPRGVELLLLQGRPLEEPIVQHGPFVANSRAEIAQAFEEYRRTEFGGWRWPDEPVHGNEKRFAKRADGRIDRPE